jgi:hypothetical protein
MMPRVFLNYRREDSAGIAGRLFDRLVSAIDERLREAKESVKVKEDELLGGRP